MRILVEDLEITTGICFGVWYCNDSTEGKMDREELT